MTDYSGVTWRVNYGEIAEREQFRVGYVGQDSYEAYFEVAALTELIDILNTVQPFAIGLIAKGVTLQAQKVDAGHTTAVVIEPLSDTNPEQIMRLELGLVNDLIYALQLFQTNLPAAPEADDWDFSDSFLIDKATGTVKKKLLPDFPSQAEIDELFAEITADLAGLDFRLDQMEEYAATLVVRGEDCVNLANYSPISDFLGTIDNTAVLQQAVDDARAKKVYLYVPNWMRVRIDGVVQARYIDIKFDGFLTAGASGMMVIGDSSNVRVGRQISFKSALHVNNAVQTNVVIRVQGLMGGFVSMGRCDLFEIYANETLEPGTGDACAYATYNFTGGSVRHLRLWGEGGQSWINENLILGGDFRRITIGGTYNNNSNLFIKPSVEGADSLIDIQKGNRNKFMYARGEYNPGIKFGAGTYHNVITDGFASNVVSRAPGFVVLEDLGTENVLAGTIDEFLEPHTVFRLDSQTPVFDTATPYPGTSVRPGLRKLQVNTSFQSIVRTGLIPLSAGTSRIRRFEGASDTVFQRPRIRLFDDNLAPLDPTVLGALIDTTGGWTAVGGADPYYQFGAARDSWALLPTSPLVKWVSIEIQASGSTAGLAFEYLSVTAFRHGRDGSGLFDLWKRAFSTDLYGATPTQGRGKKGLSFENATNRSVCTEAVQTRLTASAASAATVLTVTSSAGMATAGYVGVLLTDGTTHWSPVSAVNSGTQITLSTPLTGPAASGGLVEYAQWATRT